MEIEGTNGLLMAGKTELVSLFSWWGNFGSVRSSPVYAISFHALDAQSIG